MANIFNIPQLGPLKFFQQSDVWNTSAYTLATYTGFNPNFNFRNFDKDFYLRNLKTWMEKVVYVQPFQQGDNLCISWTGVNAGPTGPYHVRIVNCNGKVIKTTAATLHGLITGSEYLWYYSAPLWDIPEGIYFVQLLHNGYLLDKDYFMISEPIEIKQIHPNTSLLRGHNSYNDQGVFFEVDAIRLELRVHGALTELDPKSDFNVYDDQPMNLQLLSSIAYREWKLEIGIGNKPIPDYLRDKLERFLGLDTLYINDVSITRTEGSNFEPNRTDKYPLSTYAITVREKENDQSIIVTDYYPIPLVGILPEDDWFYVKSVTISGPTIASVKRQFKGVRNFVDYLNRVILGASYDKNNYYYINEFGQIFLKTNDAILFAGSTSTWTIEYYDTFIELGYEALNTETISLDSLSNPTAVSYALFSDVMDATPTEGTNITLNIVYTFTSAKNDTLRCYFTDNIINLTITATAIVHSLGGMLGKSMEGIDAPSLSIRKINNNFLKNSVGDLIAINLSGNNLPTGEVDKLILMCYDNQQAFDAGSSGVDLQSQVPSAPPTRIDPGLMSILDKLNKNIVLIFTD